MVQPKGRGDGGNAISNDPFALEMAVLDKGNNVDGVA
jgi:hypothetical protein